MKSNLFYSTFCKLICVLTMSNLVEAKLPDQWHIGLDSALETAKKEKRPIVIFITGSDWCGPCKALEKRVLSKERFYKLLNQKVVFAELDYPDGPIQPESLRKRNAYWRGQYRITSFPTLLIADYKGRPVGNAYSGDMKVEAVAKSVNAKLDLIEQRNKLFAEASNASDRKKLELLTQAFKKFDTDALHAMGNFYADELAILKKLDPENKWVKYVREYAQQIKELESIRVGSVKERIKAVIKLSENKNSILVRKHPCDLSHPYIKLMICDGQLQKALDKIVETRNAGFRNPYKFMEEGYEKDIRDAIKNNSEKNFVKNFREKQGL